MKENQKKFDGHHIKKAYNVLVGLSENAGYKSTKVNNGKSGKEKLQLNDESIEIIESKWKQVIEAKIGFKTYEEMQNSIRLESSGRFAESEAECYTVLRQRAMQLGSEESVRHAKQFVPLPTDVLLVSARKAGTTWVQQARLFRRVIENAFDILLLDTSRSSFARRYGI